jgi:hypothetical protein
VQLMQKCTHLTTVEVDSCIHTIIPIPTLFTNATLDAIASSLRNLEYLSLDGDTTWITDAAVIPLVMSCLKLTHISLSGGGIMHQVTSKSLQSIGVYCKNMKHIQFGDGECGRSISALAVLNLSDHCPKL